jgi:hypothetical protein
VLAKLAWPFLIQDFNIWFAQGLQQNANAYLKRWAGVLKGTDAGVLYRPKKYLGLGLTSLSSHFQRMQLIKCHMCKYSTDDEIRTLYERRARKEKSLYQWRPTKELTRVEQIVDHNRKYPSQRDRAGLGFVRGRYNPVLPVREHRKLCGATVLELEAEELLAHANTLPLNGVWTKWNDMVHPFDLSWKNLLYGPGQRLISFILNASVNSVPTPDLLKIMYPKTNSSCKLCSTSRCTLLHILSSCPFALTNKRYTWRHDSVLMILGESLSRLVSQVNKEKVNTALLPPNLYTSFIRPGTAQPLNRRQQSPRPGLLWRKHKLTTRLNTSWDAHLVIDVSLSLPE